MDKTLAITVLVALASVRLSSGEVYTVGDDIGWDVSDRVNYTAWACSKNFKVGDIIRFVYTKGFHDVEEVSREDYVSCHTGCPKAVYTSGNDSITIKTEGHHFFLCGVPNHCAFGQKVDIRVPRAASSPAPSISPEAAPARPSTGATPPTVGAPQPTPSGVSATSESKVAGFLLAVLAFSATFGGVILPH